MWSLRWSHDNCAIDNWQWLLQVKLKKHLYFNEQEIIEKKYVENCWKMERTSLDPLQVYSHLKRLDRWLYQLEQHLWPSVYQRVAHAPRNSWHIRLKILYSVLSLSCQCWQPVLKLCLTTIQGLISIVCCQSMNKDKFVFFYQNKHWKSRANCDIKASISTLTFATAKHRF